MAPKAAYKPAKAAGKRMRAAAPAQNIAEEDFASVLERIQHIVEAKEHAAEEKASKKSKRDKKRKPGRSRAKREETPESSDESDDDSADDAEVSSSTACLS